MPRHPARLTAAGISPARYEELRGICKQYREYRHRLALARAGIVDRPEKRSGAWHRPDPTGSAAVQLADLPEARRVRLIEQCANAVAEPVIAKAILRYVSEGRGYDYRDPPPVGRNQFYILVLLFYIELDRVVV